MKWFKDQEMQDQINYLKSQLDQMNAKNLLGDQLYRQSLERMMVNTEERLSCIEKKLDLFEEVITKKHLFEEIESSFIGKLRDAISECNPQPLHPETEEDEEKIDE